MMIWSTTVIGTRVLMDSSTNVRVGHVRNTGRKQWYCIHYATKKTIIMPTLAAAKIWLQNFI